jgi:dihydrofolate reductase
MSDVGTGKVVVNRAMSLDGFIAGPGHAMDWIADYLTADAFPEVMAATGAMLVGRGTYEVAKRMADQDTTYDGGAQFVLTHKPPDEPDPTVTFLTCGLEEAVATARSAAGDKNLEILGADVAAQCLRRGLVDEILVYVLRCYSATVSAARPQASTGSTWNLSATPSRAPSRCSASACESRRGPPTASALSLNVRRV